MAKFVRKSSHRQPRKVLRIFTEGESTEPNYFNSIKNELRMNEIDIRVKGCGDHTLPLVEWVLERKNAEEDGLETEWWIVFDKDDHTHFNEAIETASKNGIRIAHSNVCFELWFLLHFNLLSTSLSRDLYEKKLSKLLGSTYDKTKDIYQIIRSMEQDAIRNAKILEKQHDDLGKNNPLHRDPSTHVYKLVERLRELKTERK